MEMVGNVWDRQGWGGSRLIAIFNIYLCMKAHYFSLLGTDVASPHGLHNVNNSVNNFLFFHVSPSTWGLDQNLRHLLCG